MVDHSPSAAAAPRRVPQRMQRKAYRTPTMLLSLQVLDLLEISGSQSRAARSLAMHQTTVSRSYWDLAEQFRLQPGRDRQTVCRWGVSTSLRFLRLACRAHRLDDGRLRLATDALHQSLLDGLPGVLQVPPCFRSAEDWAALVEQGVIDGAIVSSLCHDQQLARPQLPCWRGVRVIALGTLMLQLVCHQRWAAAWQGDVLLPARTVMPLLHQQLEACVSSLERPSRAWQDPQVWLTQLQRRPVALPLCPALAPMRWWQEQGLVAAWDQPLLQERLWLLLPEDLELSPAAEATLRVIHRRVIRSAAAGSQAPVLMDLDPAADQHVA